MHLPRRRWRRLVPSITPASCTEEVASSRTYLEPARRIKARPTGLRLQRSRRAATCSTYLTLLLFSSISILCRRYFTRSYSLFLGVRMAVGFLGCEMDRTHRPDSVDHESQRCLWLDEIVDVSWGKRRRRRFETVLDVRVCRVREKKMPRANIVYCCATLRNFIIELENTRWLLILRVVIMTLDLIMFM